MESSQLILVHIGLYRFWQGNNKWTCSQMSMYSYVCTWLLTASVLVIVTDTLEKSSVAPDTPSSIQGFGNKLLFLVQHFVSLCVWSFVQTHYAIGNQTSFAFSMIGVCLVFIWYIMTAILASCVSCFNLHCFLILLCSKSLSLKLGTITLSTWVLVLVCVNTVEGKGLPANLCGFHSARWAGGVTHARLLVV